MKNRLPTFNKTWALWLIIAALLGGMLLLARSLSGPKELPIPYSIMMAQIQTGSVKGVRIQGSKVYAQDGKGSKNVIFVSDIPASSPLLAEAMKAGVLVQAATDEADSSLSTYLLAFGPPILLIGAWFYFMRRNQGGPAAGKGGMGGISGSRAVMSPKDTSTVRFTDVAGCDEAKEELQEIVDFLRNPAKYEKLGSYIPKGVLLSGPPGTGKTLLAKAIAGEAAVPFLSIAGSDFVEMFVGVGAGRVRSLFEQAKKHAPCIIFIDEIDAVGRHRGSGNGGGNDEREQTLNQLLVEMNGFQPNSGIIVIAATNRPDVLDKALLRPGRFDRQVTVGLPDVRGRTQILNVHMRKVPLSKDVDIETIARGTPGFAGADLQNLVNEAGLAAGRAQKAFVDMSDFEFAKDKVTMGPERKSVRIPEQERVNTAYHEAGHAVIAALLPTADPVHKVSIMPRGRSLGVTLQLPSEDRYSLSRSKILDNLAILFGGRLAEEMFTGDITTGASNDYERATALVRNMVTRWGMSDSFGQMVLGDMSLDPFGDSQQRGGALAEDTLRKADAEIQRILQEQYDRARKIIEANTDKMHAMAAALLKWETIDATQIKAIMAGEEPVPPKDETPVAPVIVDVVPAPVDVAIQPVPVLARLAT